MSEPSKRRTYGAPDAEEPHRRTYGGPELPAASPAVEVDSSGPSKEAVLQGLGQGSTFGFLPWLQARAGQAVEGGRQILGGEVMRGLGNVAQGAGNLVAPPGTPLSPMMALAPNTPDFDVERQQFNTRDKALKAANPGSYMGGNIAGSILNPATLATGGGGIAAQSLGQAVKQGAKIGMGTGAIQGLGESASEGLDLPDSAKRVGLQTVGGAVGGGLGGGAAYGIGKGVSAAKALPGVLRDAAETRAVKAMGPYAAELNKVSRGTKDWGEVQDMGRTMLDQKMVKPFENSEAIANRLATLEEIRGGNLQSALDEVAALPGAKTATSYGSLEQRVLAEAGKDAKNLAKAPYMAELKGEAGRMNALANPTADEVKAGKMAIDKLSIPEMEAVKRSYQSTTNYGTQAAGEDARKTLASLARQEVEDAAQKVSTEAGQPQLFEDFLKAKQAYADVARPLSVARPAVFRQERNRFVSPSDYGFGAAAGLASAGQAGAPASLGVGALMSMLHKQVRERGSSTAAVGLDKLASLGDAVNFAAAPLSGVGDALQGRAFQNISSNVGGQLDSILFGETPVTPAAPPGTPKEEKDRLAGAHFTGKP